MDWKLRILTLAITLSLIFLASPSASAQQNGHQVDASNGEGWAGLDSPELEVKGSKDGILSYNLPNAEKISLKIAYTGVYLSNGDITEQAALYPFDQAGWQFGAVESEEGGGLTFTMSNSIQTRQQTDLQRAGESSNGQGGNNDTDGGTAGGDGAGDGAADAGDGVGDGGDGTADGGDGTADGGDGVGDGGDGTADAGDDVGEGGNDTADGGDGAADGGDGVADGGDGAAHGGDGAADGGDGAADGGDGTTQGGDGGDVQVLLRVQLRISLSEEDREFQPEQHRFTVQGSNEAKVDIILTPTANLTHRYVFLEQRMYSEGLDEDPSGMAVGPNGKKGPDTRQGGNQARMRYAYGDALEGQAEHVLENGSSLGYYRWSDSAQHQLENGSTTYSEVDAYYSQEDGSVLFAYGLENSRMVIHDPAVGVERAVMEAALEEMAEDTVDYLREHMESIFTGIVVGVVLVAVLAGYLRLGDRGESLDPARNRYFRRPPSR